MMWTNEGLAASAAGDASKEAFARAAGRGRLAAHCAGGSPLVGGGQSLAIYRTMFYKPVA